LALGYVLQYPYESDSPAILHHCGALMASPDVPPFRRDHWQFQIEGCSVFDSGMQRFLNSRPSLGRIKVDRHIECGRESGVNLVDTTGFQRPRERHNGQVQLPSADPCDRSCAFELLHRDRQALPNPIVFGYIAEHQHHPDNGTVGIANGRRAVRDLVFRAAAGQQCGVVGQTHDRSALHDKLYRIDRGRTRLRVDDVKYLEQRSTQSFDLRPSGQPLCCRIHAGYQASGIGGNHSVSDGLQGDGKALLTQAQLLFCKFALGDIRRHAYRNAPPVRCFAKANRAELPRVLAAVPAADFMVAFVPSAFLVVKGRNTCAKHIHLLAVRFPGPICDRGDILYRIAADFRPGAAQGEDGAVLGMNHDREGSLLDGAAKSPLAVVERLRHQYAASPGHYQCSDRQELGNDQQRNPDDGASVLLPHRWGAIDKNAAFGEPVHFTGPAFQLQPVEHRDGINIFVGYLLRQPTFPLQKIESHPSRFVAKFLDADHRTANTAVAEVEIVQTKYWRIGHFGDHSFDLVGQRGATVDVRVVLYKNDDAFRWQRGNARKHVFQREVSRVLELQLSLMRYGNAFGLGDHLQVRLAAAGSKQHSLGLWKQFQRELQRLFHIELRQQAEQLTTLRRRLGNRSCLDRYCWRIWREQPTFAQ